MRRNNDGGGGLLFILMMWFLLVVLMTPPAGAADFALYAKGGFDYQLDEYTDVWLHKGCQTFNDVTEVCMGENPGFAGELGVEFAFGDYEDKWYIPVFSFGWRHRSHWFQGGPFNDEPETYSENIFFDFKFGGLR